MASSLKSFFRIPSFITIFLIGLKLTSLINWKHWFDHDLYYVLIPLIIIFIGLLFGLVIIIWDYFYNNI